MSRVEVQRPALAASAAQLGEFERWRRNHFISLRLALTMPFMALAPVFLLVRGAPSSWDVVAFAFLLAPLVGVYALHRFGRFDIAQSVCVGATLLLGVVLTLANGAITIGAVACFLLGPLEAALGDMPRFANAGAAASLVAMLAMIGATYFGWLATPWREWRLCRSRNRGFRHALWRPARRLERADGRDARPQRAGQHRGLSRTDRDGRRSRHPARPHRRRDRFHHRSRQRLPAGSPRPSRARAVRTDSGGRPPGLPEGGVRRHARRTDRPGRVPPARGARGQRDRRFRRAALHLRGDARASLARRRRIRDGDPARRHADEGSARRRAGGARGERAGQRLAGALPRQCQP